MRRALAAALALALGASLPSCKRQHYAAETLPELPYPTCEGPTEALYETTLMSGANDTRMPIVERFRWERRGCYFAAVVRQEWPAQIADVEVVYDGELRPLRAWRRLTMPHSPRADGGADTKSYELRTTPIGVRHRALSGAVDLETLRAPRAADVVVAAGRGVIGVWLAKAKLGVGEKTRAGVLDVRGVEKLEQGALERLPDRRVEALGRTVRVYTFFGKETVFADEHDRVIGDLAGLVDARAAGRAVPPPMPTYAPIDPARTP
ncbi:MAG: hypothetical protein IT374_04965 [Polyangiaceae bacterium]|nr:hypothetical protein [Polyangiaceae bacterium]